MKVYLLKYETEIGGIFSSHAAVKEYLADPEEERTLEEIEDILADRDAYIAVIEFELDKPKMIDC